MKILTLYVIAAAAKLLQLCLIYCNSKDCSPSGSSVHRILQARILEWVAIPFSRGSSHRQIYTHTHTYTYTHTYTHTQELLESEEVSSKRLEGRKEKKEGRGKTF